jgi:hypothetical protein
MTDHKETNRHQQRRSLSLRTARAEENTAKQGSTDMDKKENRWWEGAPSYKKAYEDYEFMMRDELRPVRLQLELLKPEIILQEQDTETLGNGPGKEPR